MSECSVEFIRKSDGQFVAKCRGETETIAIVIPAVGDTHTFDRCKLNFKVIEVKRHLDRFTNLTVIVYLEDF